MIAHWWPLWLAIAGLGLAIPELVAVFNKVPGDTLSERLRAWFHVDTPGGGASWLVVWLLFEGLILWLLGHIIGWWS